MELGGTGSLLAAVIVCVLAPQKGAPHIDRTM